MTFKVTIEGETPAELAQVLAKLGAAETSTKAPQSEPVKAAEPEHATTPAKPEKPTETPAAAVEEAPVVPVKDEAAEKKIRDLIMALTRQGKQPECKEIIKATGAASISKLPPESYTTVWEQLVALKESVDDAAD